MSNNRIRSKPISCLAGLLILAMGMMSGCGEETASPGRRSLSIFVSIPPQAAIVRALAGSNPSVRMLVQPGQSPATYDPTPKQMAELAEADLCFLIGVPFEERFMELAGSVLSSVLVVKTQAGIRLRQLRHHDHYEKESRTGIGDDPHLWLSPKLMKMVAVNMAEGLKQVDSANGEKYAENLNRLLSRLDTLDSDLRELLAPLAGDTIYVFHPSYGYFADEYGLIQVPLEPEGKTADASYLARLMAELDGREVRGIFVQPQFSDHLARSVASQIGTDLIELDPLSEDYFENMRSMARQVAYVLSDRLERVESSLKEESN